MIRLTIQGVDVQVETVAEAAELLQGLSQNGTPASRPSPPQKTARTKPGSPITDTVNVPKDWEGSAMAWILLDTLVSRRRANAVTLQRATKAKGLGGIFASVGKVATAYGIDKKTLYSMSYSRKCRVFFAGDGAVKLHRLMTEKGA